MLCTVIFSFLAYVGKSLCVIEGAMVEEKKLYCPSES